VRGLNKGAGDCDGGSPPPLGYNRPHLVRSGTAMYVWLKAFHIIFMVCWFAGIFYLPRLFVNHAMTTDAATGRQLAVMARKLYRFVTPFAVLTVALGVWLILLNPAAYQSAGWLHLKIALVAALAVYHVICGRFVRRFVAGTNQRGHVFFRVFNELPVLILFAVVILAVVKPF
jgi:putative membrane protein